MESAASVPRPSLEADVVCVGFGPAAGGFLTALSRAVLNDDGSPALVSRVLPGMPLQVLCYERADDVAFGVSGAVTRGRALRESFPGLDVAVIPRACPVTSERVLYLLDPVGASRRSRGLRMVDGLLRGARGADHAVGLPWIPPFLRKEDGFVFPLGQLNQWIASELAATGTVQIWPGMPVAAPLFEGDRVVGVRLADQGTDAAGDPADGYTPGMDVRAALTVVADGPVGPVGRQLDERFGLPPGHRRRDWAVGMKMVVDLPESCPLEPGAVLHTFGYPEPEVFGFLYVLADRTASVGVFVPSWLDSPTRTAYRTLQHWMLHPAVRRHLDGGSMRSWGAKSLLESGRRGEPYLVGDGFARIGEGSGTTNVLTGSGVDEAWKSGTLLAEGVIRLLREDRPFTAANLEEAYVRPRRKSWLDAELRAADGARDGFQRGVLTGLLGMGLTGLSGGRIRLPGDARRPHERVPPLASRLGEGATADDADRLRRAAAATGTPLHDEVLRRAGWPDVPLDGRLLVSQQDALLVGGKVQAPPGYADHIVFRRPLLCETCRERLCIEICSGQAITPGGDGGSPRFDREKCVHCGACVWSCTRTVPGDPDTTNIELRAGAGGLHSVEN